MRSELDKSILLPRQSRTSLSQATLPLCRKIMRLEKIDAECLEGEEVEFIRNGPLSSGFGSGSQALNNQQVEPFAGLWREVLGSQISSFVLVALAFRNPDSHFACMSSSRSLWRLWRPYATA